ncbi:MAG: uroporphyrinogen decarboxylase family protein [bacterium]
MTSKSIVLQAINGEKPARVPLLYCNRDFEYSDVQTAGCGVDVGFIPSQPGMTEWGYAWMTLDGTMGQPASHPLADDDTISSYILPNPYTPGRMSHIPGWAAANADKFLVFGLGITGFNQATFLRGFEQFLTDLYTAPKIADRVLDYVFDFENGLIKQLKDMPIDCVKFADDWGTQQDLIINPALWRKIFKPRYAAQFDRVHKSGKKVWFHTCGQVHAILGDLIDIGVDVLELLQPDIFGVEKLAADFGGKVTFCCSVDHQRRAITGTRKEIFDYVHLLKEKLGGDTGRFIGYIEDYASLGMGEAQYQWIREAFHGVSHSTS